MAPRSMPRSLSKPGLPVVAAAAVAAIAAWSLWPEGAAPPADPSVTVVAGQAGVAAGVGAAGPDAGPGAATGIALLATFVGGTPASSSATLAMAGGATRTLRIGDAVAEGVTLAGVAEDHVVLDENGTRTRLYRMAAVAGARRGLEPEPVRASGELTGDEIARRMQSVNLPALPTPEEAAAGR